VALSAGTRLGPYEILAPLGAGGMGEVYRARDTRLDRTVALKVLPAELASEPTLRARFEREARAISALEHPHICTLYDVGEENSQAYLVMEHLSGETLAERLKKGPQPLSQALEVAAQIAEALAAAHKQGIVHRDLKPGNVMLTKTGVKLLDFGLARLTGHGEQPVIEASTPTESAPLTGKGTILGTVPYMAPEQLEGKPADARTDLWALGAIVYEMVAGRRAFEGSSQVSLIAAIVEREPVALSTLQPVTPPSLERLVKRCLAKSPDDRWDGAHDVAEELRWIGQSGIAGQSSAHAGARLPTRRLIAGGVTFTVIGALLGGVLERRVLRPAAPRPSLVRSQLDLRPAEDLAAGFRNQFSTTPGGSLTALAWTPDGKALVFVGLRAGVRQLYVRELDRDEARPLAGTESAQALAVSPDGRWVAFWAEGALRKAPLGAGPAAVIVGGVGFPFGIAYSAAGDVFFANEGGGIWRASAERAPAAVTTLLEAEISHRLPALLPGDRVLLYTARRRRWTWGDEDVCAHVLATGERKVLLHDAVDARYLPTGHLAFMRRGTLFAVPFDPERLEVQGSPVAVLDDVSQALTAGGTGGVTGAGQFSVAPNGALAYVPGPVVPYPAEKRLVALDRSGRVSPLTAAAHSYGPGVDISPDGRRLTLSIRDLKERSLWVHDVQRGTLNKLTSEGEVDFPRWTPDGQRLAFSWLRRGHELGWQRADGTAPPEILAPAAGTPSSWSPDGRQLALVKEDDIWVATVADSRASAQQITRTPQAERWPAFSPDGRWLAYGDNVSGRFEVYVQPWPGPGPREQVSIDGGESPAWNPAGGELFFLAREEPAGMREMMVADVRTSPTLRLGTPRPLFKYAEHDGLELGCNPVRCFSVAPDGQRFYGIQGPPAPALPPVTHVNLVQNWTEELKARVAAGTGR
jgi:eukaryotic-like serine/threonine-protein kinase